MLMLDTYRRQRFRATRHTFHLKIFDDTYQQWQAEVRKNLVLLNRVKHPRANIGFMDVIYIKRQIQVDEISFFVMNDMLAIDKRIV